MKTEGTGAFENGFKSGAFWKCSVSSMDRWKRLLKTVQKKASNNFVSISVFGRFSVDNRRKRIKKYAFSNENAYGWTVENESKSLVWAKILCFVFVSTKTDVEWSGPKLTKVGSGRERTARAGSRAEELIANRCSGKAPARLPGSRTAVPYAEGRGSGWANYSANCCF